MNARISWDRRRILQALTGGGLIAGPGLIPQSMAVPANTGLRPEAEAALRKATRFFRARVAVQGGYLWRTSEDLARREGEAKATSNQAWVQPPGTPSVGMVYLAAWEATQDPYYLEAARETAGALVKGQLRSGGWDYLIEFDPALRSRYAYRTDAANERGKNVTTLDDDTTQAALRFLMRTDRALESRDTVIHEAVEYALASLLKAQYPNGAWPQRFDRPPDPAQFPARQAAYPESWSREWPAGDYRAHYTFNDGNIDRMIETLLEAERLYGRPEYRAAVERAGGFILLARMPEPQPAWAQQYDTEMHPAWARKFEPPAVTGGESQTLLRTLMRLYRETGDRKYLEPVPRALEYLEKSRLPDGRLARFYELRTNRPLYFTKDYRLTYDDSDLPTHYAFKVADRTASLRKEYEQLRAAEPASLKKPAKAERPRLTPELEADARRVLAALDEQGRWVEEGRLKYHGPDDPTRRILDSETFARNVTLLSRYLAAARVAR